MKNISFKYIYFLPVLVMFILHVWPFSLWEYLLTIEFKKPENCFGDNFLGILFELILFLYMILIRPILLIIIGLYMPICLGVLIDKKNEE